jgi:tetratricopeptide (TPR) repeat protein
MTHRLISRPLASLAVGVSLLFTGAPAASGSQEASIQEAEALNQQSVQLLQQGRFNDAIPLAQRVLSIREEVLGPEHPATADSLTNLALLYHYTAPHAQVEPGLQRALAINEKSLGPEHPHLAASLYRLAALRWALGDSAAALSLSDRAQAIDAQNLGRFLLTGAESRKRAYLAGLRESTFGAVSLSVALTSP